MLEQRDPSLGRGQFEKGALNTLVDNMLSKTYSPKLAASVYERVGRNLSERGDSANWNEISGAIVAVMKTKSGMKMEEDQLVMKVLDRLTKTSSKKTMELIVNMLLQSICYNKKCRNYNKIRHFSETVNVFQEMS